jgi:ASC-1-like (ASCH) protein
MAKKKKEEPIVDNEVGSLKVKAKKEKQPDGNETKGNVTKVKEKMTMKPMVEKETITKVDLNKPSKEETDAVQEPETNASDAIIALSLLKKKLKNKLKK